MQDSGGDEGREAKLQRFVDWAAANITGDEKGQAQIFLDRLFIAFGQKGSLDVGGSPEMRIRKSEEDGGGTSFADYVWKPVVLIEMKKRGIDLAKHYRQAQGYWFSIYPDRPQFVVLCNFDEFWVYDFNAQPFTPKDKVKLTELPTRWGPLAFLFPTREKPVFGNDQEKVTREASDKLATCFQKLVTRKIDRNLAQRFILQSLIALFAEDIGLLPRYLFGKLLEECKKPEDGYDLIGGLFEAMNNPVSPTGGRYEGVRYFNGGIFAHPARLNLYPDELNQLKQCSAGDWSKVSPEIFGALFQDSMDAEERHAYGAHFTSPIDIMKIVGPTITQPWEAAIKAARNAKQLNALLERLTTLRVLDPACGSGNFLYLAYREMRRLEALIRERLTTEFPGEQPQLIHVNARQFYGMDINPFAVELAKVTLMIARKLAIDELHIADERDLPLDNLDANFRIGDALLSDTANLGEKAFSSAVQTKWEPADVVIGNPPFLDARKTTLLRGREYVAQLGRLYPEVPRRADYCTYWIRRTHEHLQSCTQADPFVGRAGLVGTQNIRNNASRLGGLESVVASGTVIEAVDNQPWSGEANVHVSIVNWAKTKDPKILPVNRRIWSLAERRPLDPNARRKGASATKLCELKLRQCAFISSSLSDLTDVAAAFVISANRTPKRCFEGQQPGHKGFRLNPEEAVRILATAPNSAGVVFAYMTGGDLVANKYVTPNEYVIDFADMDVNRASGYAAAFSVVQTQVLAKWKENADREHEETGTATGEHQGRLETWWQLKRRRGDLLAAISRKPRYVVCSRVTKRPIFCFLQNAVHPDSSLSCFVLEDDYSFGILQSNSHWQWFVTKCSKLKSDFRYTPDSVFDTFPWPQSPTNKQIDAVAAAAVLVRKVRAEALTQIDGGLRALYRTLELPGKNPLKDAHAALDAAVLAAYGFDPKKDLLSQLLDLNRAVAAKEKAGEPVTAPGVPSSYGDAAALVTDDCIRP